MLFRMRYWILSQVSGAPTLFELVCGSQGVLNHEWPVIGSISPAGSLESGTENERFTKYLHRLTGSCSYLTAAERLEKRYRPGKG